MDNEKVIEEVDEKLEGSARPHNIPELDSIYGELTRTSVQVNRMLAKLTGYRSDAGQSGSYLQRPPSASNQLPNSSTLSKYNYGGRKYRFEQREQELRLSPVKVQRQCKSEVAFVAAQAGSPTARTQQNMGSGSLNATIDHSLFFDEGRIQMPANNYYIYFDKGGQHGGMKKGHSGRQVHEDEGGQKFKPAWLMEKKINSLQKQVKELKQKQKIRNREHLHKTKPGHRTLDSSINMKSNLERMVDSLWRN